MKIKHITVVLAPILILTFTVLLSLATENQAITNWKGPCAPDVQKFCADVNPGGGRIVECLNAHAQDLSPACQERRAELKKEAKEIHKDCLDDAQKFCQNVKPGQGRILKCLIQHKSEISAQCQTALAAAKAQNQLTNSQPK